MVQRCKIKGCNNNVILRKKLGYCNKHMLQMGRYGRTLKFTEKDKNEVTEYSDHFKIHLYERQGAGQEPRKVKEALVDKDDIEKVRKHKWGLSGRVGNKHNHLYVSSRINGKITYLHTFILGKRDGHEIDHANRDTLDNRKNNLRFCTRSQNTINRVKSQGYRLDKKAKKWYPNIKVGGKNINLGFFKTKKAAMIIRKRAEKKYYGEYATDKKEYVVGLTFGVFDLFHYGHKNLLRNARKRCDVLIVCVSDEEYALKHKGIKPTENLFKRKKTVYSSRYVDAVRTQSLKFGKKEAIDYYNPSVLFVGSDHKGDYTGEGLGVHVVYLPHTDGISSTMLRKKLGYQ